MLSDICLDEVLKWHRSTDEFNSNEIQFALSFTHTCTQHTHII